jgi:hypothetical protein
MNSCTRPADGALNFALDMLSAMAEAGLVQVPVKPSTNMLTAGAKAGGTSVSVAWKVYNAMLEAA